MMQLKFDGKVKVSREYKVSVEALFNAWSTVEGFLSWWKKLDAASIDFRVGGRYQFKFKNGGCDSPEDKGEYIEIVPNRKIVFTWLSPDDSKEQATTLVTLDFEDLGQGSRLTITHDGLNKHGRPSLPGHAAGWNECLRMAAEGLSAGINFVSNTNLGIFVTDIARAKAFYSGVLGFQLLEEEKNKLVYNTGACLLFVSKEDGMQTPVVPALEVKNYDEAKAHLTNNGCEIVREWPAYKALFFRDPLGNIFDIIETNS